MINVRDITDLLESQYGVAVWRARFEPVDELIACILSQHTSDTNSLRAFDQLKARFPSWDEVIAADTREIANTIRCGGLADSKAPRIQEVLRRIREQQGAVSLACLNSMTDSEARDYLMSLPGVGPKTAAIALCFALNRPVIPVDTHIFRVCWRLGLFEKRIGEAKAHDVLQAMIPQDIIYRFHVAIIQHGRQVCKAPRPRCSECVLSGLCAYFKENSAPHDGADQ